MFTQADRAAGGYLPGSADLRLINGLQAPDKVTADLRAHIEAALAACSATDADGPRRDRLQVARGARADAGRQRAGGRCARRAARGGGARRDDGGPRRAGGDAHARPGRRAGLQGLPRLPGDDLRVGERRGGPRHPLAARAASRATSSRSTSARCSTGSTATAAVTVPVGRVSEQAAELLRVTEESLHRGHRESPGGLPDLGHRPRGAGARRGARILGGPRVRRARHRGGAARGAADPELRRPGARAAAGRGHGAGDRADGEHGQGRPCGCWATAGRR